VLVVLDACVLYPPSLCDLLLTIAALDALDPRWSEAILEELRRNVVADNPTSIRTASAATRWSKCVGTSQRRWSQWVRTTSTDSTTTRRHVAAAAAVVVEANAMSRSTEGIF
jgi:hypothetical protein